MAHYFTNEEKSSNPKTFDFEFRNRIYKFTSDDGVFSKNFIDFGSRLLIENFDYNLKEGRILDVGCGYGPIGITIASNTDKLIHMVDVNLRALELAKLNAANNDVSNVKIYESNCLDSVEGEFASILTNPPIRAGKQIVHQIFEQAHEKLVVGGELWIVIRKQQGAASAIKKVEVLFSNVEVVTKSKGYLIIKCKK